MYQYACNKNIRIHFLEYLKITKKISGIDAKGHAYPSVASSLISGFIMFSECPILFYVYLLCYS